MQDQLSRYGRAHRRTAGAGIKCWAVAVAVAVATALTLAPGAPAAAKLSGKYRTTISSGDLKGTWTLSFRKTSYTVDGPFPGQIRGRQTYSGAVITFNHEKNDADETCGERPGKYRFSMSAKTLRLTRISDSCLPRRLVFSHKLTKIG